MPPGSVVPPGFVESATVFRRFAPGSTSCAVGFVLSIRRSVTTVASLLLPATSYATVRKS